MSRKVFMAQGLTKPNTAGVTRVIFNRSRILAERGYDVDILNFDFTETSTEELMFEARKIGRLAKDVNIINVHDYYRKKNTKSNRIDVEYYEKKSTLHEKDLYVQLNEFKTKSYARYFNNSGQYVMFKRWRKNDTLSHINYFNKYRIRVQTDEFHQDGYLIRKKFYEPSTEMVVQELHYTSDGFCYLNKWFDPENGRIVHIFSFDVNSNEVKIFNNNREFHTHWLNELCSSYSSKPYLICDGIGSTHKVLGMNPNVAYRIYTLHNNHFDKPYTVGSPLKDNFSRVVPRVEELEVLVVLTDEQKLDIINEFGEFNNIAVVPNSVSVPKEINVGKDTKKISMYARYHHQKNVEEAIYAFDIVRKKDPMAKLEIYGSGGLRGHLQGIIDELGLDKNVILMGYEFHIEETMASSIATVLTSRYEGFGLVIAESMANGTPVISYNVKYGPAQIIEDEVDGYLVSQGDRRQLAKRIIELLENPEKAISMGIKARENIKKKFSEKVIGDRWESLFGDLDNEIFQGKTKINL